MSVLIVTVLKYKVRSSSCQHHTLVFRYTQLHVTAEKESRYTIQHNRNCNSRKHEWSSETYAHVNINIYVIDKYVWTAVTRSSVLESSYDRKLPITFESLLTSASLIWSSTSLIPRLSLNYSRTYWYYDTWVITDAVYTADTLIDEWRVSMQLILW